MSKAKVNFEGGRIWSDKDTEKAYHTNPSIGIDGMNDYQATYNKGGKINHS
jgi:hypothetical protein